MKRGRLLILLVSLSFIVATLLTGCGPWRFDGECPSGVSDWTGCVPASMETETFLFREGYEAYRGMTDTNDVPAQATPIPTPPAPSTVANQPIEPTAAPAGPAVTRATFTAAQLDALFGEKNWSCFYDRDDGVAVKSWPLNMAVTYPLSAVDKGVKYTLGQTVPGTGAATAWLGGTLPRDQCPLPDVPVVAPSADCNISRYGGIRRFPDRSDAVELTASAPFVAPNGWTFDREGVKYQPYQVVPAGLMTAWAPQACYGLIR